mgnify:CR=1 FL=1
MFKPTKLKQLQKLIDQANSILVILDSEAEFDHKVSAASLFLSLKEKGKKVEFLSPKALTNHTIIGFNQLKTDIGNRSLLISFDYDEQAVAKVSYHIDEQDQKFFLNITPKEGHEPLDQETVVFEKAGSDADLIFLIGVESLEELEQLYYGYEELYQQATTVVLNESGSRYGGINLNSQDYSCVSEAVVSLIEGAGIGISSSAATNLFAGLNYSTDSFSDPDTTAYTFEAAAKLLRAGARRGSEKKAVQLGESQAEAKSLGKSDKAGVRQALKQGDVPKTKKKEKQKVSERIAVSSEVSEQEEKEKGEENPPVRPSGLRI